MNRIQNALSRTTDTKALIIARDALPQTAEMFAELFPGRRAIIIADTNTYPIAGQAVVESFRQSGIGQDEPVVFQAPEPHAEWTYVEKLMGILNATDAVPIAVGSGVINDLVKVASHRCGRRYLCVGTAASMDGYTAYGSSITYKGSKQAFDCPAPLGMLIDTRVVAAAPRDMSASGYADLLAKVPAGADWMLADAIGAEPMNKPAFDMVQDGLLNALGDPKGVNDGREDRVEPLVEGLLLAGFAMQAHHSSRPASGAEHQFSHLWDMEHHTFNGQGVSHGFKVGIGTLASTAFHEFLIAAPVGALDIDACVSAWPSWDATEKEIRRIFDNDENFLGRCIGETKAKYATPGELRAQLSALREKWTQLKPALEKQILPFAEIKRRLREVGAAHEPEQIGISRAKLRETFTKVPYMRSRVNVIDVAVRCRFFDAWLDRLFGSGGVWEIK